MNKRKRVAWRKHRVKRKKQRLSRKQPPQPAPRGGSPARPSR
jgi:hypothetical protein